MSELEATLLFQFRAYGLPAPEREYRFRPERRWRFDFAFLDNKVAVEVEGGVWANGRHTRGSGFENDCRKYAEAAIQGWRVIRVTGGMVESGEAIQLIERALGRVPEHA